MMFIPPVPLIPITSTTGKRIGEKASLLILFIGLGIFIATVGLLFLALRAFILA